MTKLQSLKLKELETKAESNLNYCNELKKTYKIFSKENKNVLTLSIIKDLFLESVQKYEIAEAELKTIQTIKELLKED